MSYSEYHARCWAKSKSDDEIRAEIIECDKRYYKPYPRMGVECAQNTIDRIDALNLILEERCVSSLS